MAEAENIDKAAAFFDLDLTITDSDSFRLFLKRYYAYDVRKAHYTSYIILVGLSRKIRMVSLRTFKEKALVGLKTFSEEKIRRIGERVFERDLKKVIRIKAVEKIAWHKNNGDIVYIVSASPNIYVHAFAQFLGCDGYICTDLDFKGGLFTGEIKGNDCIGNEKAVRVTRMAKMKGIDLSRSVAYSDHEADIPLLERVGYPVAVSPTPQMEAEAMKRKWVVENW